MRKLVASRVSLRLASRAVRFLRFGLVGMSGYVVNTAALSLFSNVVGIHYLIAAALATQASTAWNYVLTDLWVYGSRDVKRGRLSRFSMFWLMNNATLLLRLPLLWLLTSALGVHLLISNVLSLGAVTVARFWASDEYIWGDSD